MSRRNPGDEDRDEARASHDSGKPVVSRDLWRLFRAEINNHAQMLKDGDADDETPEPTLGSALVSIESGYDPSYEGEGYDLDAVEALLRAMIAFHGEDAELEDFRPPRADPFWRSNPGDEDRDEARTGFSAGAPREIQIPSNWIQWLGPSRGDAESERWFTDLGNSRMAVANLVWQFDGTTGVYLEIGTLSAVCDYSDDFDKYFTTHVGVWLPPSAVREGAVSALPDGGTILVRLVNGVEPIVRMNPGDEDRDEARASGRGELHAGAAASAWLAFRESRWADVAAFLESFRATDTRLALEELRATFRQAGEGQRSEAHGLRLLHDALIPFKSMFVPGEPAQLKAQQGASERIMVSVAPTAQLREVLVETEVQLQRRSGTPQPVVSWSGTLSADEVFYALARIELAGLHGYDHLAHEPDAVAVKALFSSYAMPIMPRPSRRRHRNPGDEDRDEARASSARDTSDGSDPSELAWNAFREHRWHDVAAFLKWFWATDSRLAFEELRATFRRAEHRYAEATGLRMLHDALMPFAESMFVPGEPARNAERRVTAGQITVLVKPDAAWPAGPPPPSRPMTVTVRAEVQPPRRRDQTAPLYTWDNTLEADEVCYALMRIELAGLLGFDPLDKDTPDDVRALFSSYRMPEPPRRRRRNPSDEDRDEARASASRQNECEDCGEAILVKAEGKLDEEHRDTICRGCELSRIAYSLSHDECPACAAVAPGLWRCLSCRKIWTNEDPNCESCYVDDDDYVTGSNPGDEDRDEARASVGLKPCPNCYWVCLREHRNRTCRRRNRVHERGCNEGCGPPASYVWGCLAQCGWPPRTNPGDEDRDEARASTSSGPLEPLQIIVTKTRAVIPASVVKFSENQTIDAFKKDVTFAAEWGIRAGEHGPWLGSHWSDQADSDAPRGPLQRTLLEITPAEGKSFAIEISAASGLELESHGNLRGFTAVPGTALDTFRAKVDKVKLVKSTHHATWPLRLLASVSPWQSVVMVAEYNDVDGCWIRERVDAAGEHEFVSVFIELLPESYVEPCGACGRRDAETGADGLRRCKHCRTNAAARRT